MSWDEKSDPRALIESCGDVLMRGHFVGASGLHLDAYFAKNNLFQHPEQLGKLCRQLWFPFGSGRPWPHSPPGTFLHRRAIVGPETGGAIIARACVEDMLAKHAHAAQKLGAELRGPECHTVCVAKTADGLGYELTPEQAALLNGIDVIVVEDVLTTGGSVRKVVDLVKAAGANVLRVAAIVNRGGVTSEMVGAKLHALLTLDLPTWTEQRCALEGPCSRGEPIRTDLGKGAQFLAARAACQN